MVTEKNEREGKARKAGDEAEGNEGKRKKRELGGNKRRKNRSDKKKLMEKAK